MTVRFVASLALNGVPTVRHIRDIEESLRGLLRGLCHQREDNLTIASATVEGMAMRVRFTAELELLGIMTAKHAAEVETAIRADLRRLRCFAADELAVEWREVRRGAARELAAPVALERIA